MLTFQGVSFPLCHLPFFFSVRTRKPPRVNGNQERRQLILLFIFLNPNFELAKLFFFKKKKDFPPAEYTSRIEHILMPVLENLASQSNNALITKPDLIEMCSGYWDLRQWSEEDRILLQQRSRTTISNPYEFKIGFGDLSQDRLDWWTERQEKAIRFVADTFPHPQTPILWRALHHTQSHHWVAFDRINQIDQLARYNIERLKQEDSRLESRLRIDEWG